MQLDKDSELSMLALAAVASLKATLDAMTTGFRYNDKNRLNKIAIDAELFIRDKCPIYATHEQVSDYQDDFLTGDIQQLLIMFNKFRRATPSGRDIIERMFGYLEKDQNVTVMVQSKDQTKAEFEEMKELEEIYMNADKANRIAIMQYVRATNNVLSKVG